MTLKHSLMNKLLAIGTVAGALTMGADSAQAANPAQVNVFGAGSLSATSTNTTNKDSVSFTVHSYVAYAALDVTGVTDGKLLTGVRYKSEAFAICNNAPGPLATANGTNFFDGDIWYVACLGFYQAASGRVTVNN